MQHHQESETKNELRFISNLYPSGWPPKINYKLKNFQKTRRGFKISRIDDDRIRIGCCDRTRDRDVSMRHCDWWFSGNLERTWFNLCSFLIHIERIISDDSSLKAIKWSFQFFLCCCCCLKPISIFSKQAIWLAVTILTSKANYTYGILLQLA